MDSPALVSATLRGGDLTADCILEVWKERLPTGHVFTRARFVDCPSDLPDGSYAVTFAGYTVIANRLQGEWELNCLSIEMNIGIDDGTTSNVA